MQLEAETDEGLESFYGGHDIKGPPHAWPENHKCQHCPGRPRLSLWRGIADWLNSTQTLYTPCRLARLGFHMMMILRGKLHGILPQPGHADIVLKVIWTLLWYALVYPQPRGLVGTRKR